MAINFFKKCAWQKLTTHAKETWQNEQEHGLKNFLKDFVTIFHRDDEDTMINVEEI